MLLRDWGQEHRRKVQELCLAKRLMPEAFEDVDLLTETGTVIDSLHIQMKDVITGSDGSKDVRNYMYQDDAGDQVASPPPNRLVRVDSVGDDIVEAQLSAKRSQRNFHAEMRQNKALADSLMRGPVRPAAVSASAAGKLDLAYQQRLVNTEKK